MKTTMAMKPHIVALKPFSMLSRPRLGPTVRSSMISIGAASEPARIRSDRSRVSFGVNAPVIWKRLPNSLWIVATEIASPLFFSNRMIAIRCLTFSRVTRRMVRPPASSSSTATAGRWSWSKVAEAPMNWSPVTSTSFFAGTWPIVPSRRRSGNTSTPKVAPVRIASSSTRRTSSVAVRPRISLARAVSCTPGSCTTTRSAPCCWITGSATPSSFTRLCSVRMFCCSAFSWTRFWNSGLTVATSSRSRPSSRSATCRSGTVLRISARACSRVGASRKRTRIVWPSRAMPAWRTFFSRSWPRSSAAMFSTRLVIAALVSTCRRKCTPPRRSRPRYIGSAWIAVSQVGEAESRLSATE